jgi:hypothetical protein
MNIRREVKYLYLRLLKEQGKIADVKHVHNFYSTYGKLRMLLKLNPEVPDKIYLPAIKMPKYLQWIKKYVIKNKRTK